ncbi:AraC family transcriptional regulator [Pseudoxanthomonas broegbernensis]|uniref:AraC family transcriptional regulator n=2 Tax=Pseudoxanthomonas broegbernensis TaxID=83619 RepID=A0A7V8GKX7_9GAMM|nr:helix-turn-helix domain-containing protein [Pseudoxanthomonas broegbernensis]KAF1685435.1 AraC family transcriptional regulator [Pseudoxanthomonas broegbernensis]
MVDEVSLGKHDEVLRAYDLVSLGGVLQVCDLEMVLLDDNGPRADIHSLVHDEALFCTVQCGFRFRGRFMLPVDWGLLGFVHETGAWESWCHGTVLPSGSAVTVLPEGITEIAVGAGACLTLMLVPLRRLQRKLSEINLRGAGMPGHALQTFVVGDDSWGQHLVARYRHLRESLASQECVLGDEEVDALIDIHVQAAQSAGAASRPVCSRGRRAYYLMLQRAENFMRANMRRDIYIEEICEAAGGSERALRYAFDHLLGTSPKRYLSMLRLCAACRGLSMANSTRRSVKAIALSCGLWDLSRFAENYRRVFGELPRDTLMRSPMGSGTA